MIACFVLCSKSAGLSTLRFILCVLGYWPSTSVHMALLLRHERRSWFLTGSIPQSQQSVSCFASQQELEVYFPRHSRIPVWCPSCNISTIRFSTSNASSFCTSLLSAPEAPDEKGASKETCLYLKVACTSVEWQSQSRCLRGLLISARHLRRAARNSAQQKP